MPKILLIEDDNNLGQELVRWLTNKSYSVEWASNCALGREFATSYAFDVMVIDWELPDGAGPTLCQEFRKSYPQVPILMLTARSVVSDRVHGLDCGADDYVCKPCPPEEILARLRALIRRKLPHEDQSIKIDSVEIKSSAREVSVEGKAIDLSPKQFELLMLLARNAGTGESLSPDAIVSRLAASGIELTRSVIKVYVSQIKAKLAEAGATISIVFEDGGYCLK